METDEDKLFNAPSDVEQSEEVSVAPPMPPDEEDGTAPDMEEEASDEAMEVPRQEVRDNMMEHLNGLTAGMSQVGSRMFTICVACGSPLHSLGECDADAERRDIIIQAIQYLRTSVSDYPTRARPQDAHASAASATTGHEAPMDVPMDGQDADETMDVNSSTSSHRPRNRTGPRRTHASSGMITIRYENVKNLQRDIRHRRGETWVCGVEPRNIGPENNEEVERIISTTVSHLDRALPQRGDLPIYARQGNNGNYANDGYVCISDNVRGGILDLVPDEGVYFMHAKWGALKPCVPRDVSAQTIRNAGWALKCIQTDLRHRLGRASGTTYVGGRREEHNLFYDILRCDEGGWVLIDELVRKEVLWTHSSRRITRSANVRDADQRHRMYQERIQAIIDGNLIGSRGRNGKIRLQFLGVRVKDPPEGPNPIGSVGTNNLVTRTDQVSELRAGESTRHQCQYLESCDEWVRPWAVRAVSGHSKSSTPGNNLVEVDQNRFAISPSNSLMETLGGCYHATDCRNARSIVDRGLVPGAQLEGAAYYGNTYESGRIHSYLGLFPPWDTRNFTTKDRVVSQWNQPMVAFYIPSIDLIRQGGRITGNGVVIIPTELPFSMVKEAWFLVPSSRDAHRFEHVEKILDETIENEIVLEFNASPIHHEFKPYRTPAVVMQLLCDMQSNPHQAEKDRIMQNLVISLDYDENDPRRDHYMKDGVSFVIRHTRPGDHIGGEGRNQCKLRVCPACYNYTPAKFSRCLTCWSLFFSSGQFMPAEDPTASQTHVEVPEEDITRTMEEATIAVDTEIQQEQANEDAATVGEPETEMVDVPMEDEPEPDAENLDDNHGDDQGGENTEERRAVLLQDEVFMSDPKLTVALASMQSAYHHIKGRAQCVDAVLSAFSYMAYIYCRTIHKTWTTTTMWLNLPYTVMKEKFDHGSRYDVLGTWPTLCEVDENTFVSRDVTDEEVIQAARNKPRKGMEDPQEDWILRKFRANQMLSQIVRGAVQLGYQRYHFDASYHYARAFDTKEVHWRCLQVLNEVLPRVTGCTSFAMLVDPRHASINSSFLNLDMVGTTLITHIDECSATTIAFFIDHDIRVPAKYVDKLTKSRVDRLSNPNASVNALRHITLSEHVEPGRQSVMDAPVTTEERQRVDRPPQPKGPPPSWRHRSQPSNSNQAADELAGKGEARRGHPYTNEEREEQVRHGRSWWEDGQYGSNRRWWR